MIMTSARFGVGRCAGDCGVSATEPALVQPAPTVARMIALVRMDVMRAVDESKRLGSRDVVRRSSRRAESAHYVCGVAGKRESVLEEW